MFYNSYTQLYVLQLIPDGVLSIGQDCQDFFIEEVTKTEMYKMDTPSIISK